MKLEYNENSNVGIAPFGYDPRTKLAITLNGIYILETGNETFADNCEKIADDYAIEFAKFIANEDYDLDFWVNNADIKNLLEIFKKEKGL